jgi:D-alanyl-D-alanine dipeptidase
MINFHPNIQKLRETPIKINDWIYKQVGRKNDGPFKKNYQGLITKECGEEMVDIDGYKISNDEYYKNYFLEGSLISKKIFLRESHAKRLFKVDKFFRDRGLYIHIVSGWRHPKLQKMIKEKYASKFGQKKADRLYASIDWKVSAPHCTGSAFDIELRDLSSKKKIRMNVYFNNEKVDSLYWAEELLKKDKLKCFSIDAVKNRRILYHALCTKNVIFKKKKDLFTGHPGEYWHFSDGDVLSSFLNKKKFTKYGIIYPKF